MSIRLRELISSVRNAKTAAEERAVIQKECANIRTALQQNHPYRARNVTKLMYIHMLGYPTHFGQMECVNLVVSHKYPEKRIGYLGLMILLDETQEVLTLVENTLKKDLDDSNQFVQALALSTIANIASPDICRSLSAEVQKLLTHSPYIRKKAALAAIRIIRKVPELIDDFASMIPKLLSEQSNHGVLITLISLMNEIMRLDPRYIVEYRELVPHLLRILKTLMNSTYSLEHDVSGIADPFLQVKILQTLRILGKGDAKTSELMTDVLGQVASMTEGNKDAGNAILYECAQTIMGIEAESGLRNLAITILGKFLVNKNNNMRYVALHTLKQVVGTDPNAVNRHVKTIVDCLKDPDISIRKRALDLIYVLVNKNNIRFLVDELIHHLNRTDSELKEDLTTKICIAVEKFAPSVEWKINTMLKVLTLAGDHIRDDIALAFIGNITQHPELQLYTVHKLYAAIRKIPKKQETLIRVAAWCVGEYGDLLLEDDSGKLPKLSKEDIVDTLIKLLNAPTTSDQNKAIIITSLAKLANTFQLESGILNEIKKYRDHYQLEIQQRSCEYVGLYGIPADIRAKIVDKMPAIEKIATIYDDEMEKTSPVPTKQPKEIPKIITQSPKTTTATTTPTLLTGELLPGLGDLTTTDETPSQPTNTNDVLLNLLEPITPQNPSSETPSNNDVLGSLLLPMGDTSESKFVAFEKDGLRVKFSMKKSDEPGKYSIVATYSNLTSSDMINFEFMAAVPRYMKLQLKKASSSTISAKSEDKVEQHIQLINLDQTKKLIMKIRMQYEHDGKKVLEEGTVSNFPII